MNIKYFIFCLIFVSGLSFAQQRPTIMVVPSDQWCLKNGYEIKVDNQGTQKRFPDYVKAFQDNADLNLVISKLGEMMVKRDFPLESMEEVMKQIEESDATAAMLTSGSGASISESPMDKLMKKAKADIKMEISYTLNQMGPKQSVTFNLVGKDSYTGKQIAAASGTGPQSFSAPLPVLLEEAVLSHFDNFTTQLMSHFDNVIQNGREVKLTVKKFDSFDGDLEKEYNGKELRVIIEDWVAENTVNKQFTVANSTENMINFKQVRIPLKIDGKGINAESWARSLRSMLKSQYQIVSKLSNMGVGDVILTIGEK